MKYYDILYEDNHLLVIYKYAGVLSQEDNSKDPDLVNLLKAYLKEKYSKPGNVYLGLVHRLDRMTEGVMVFAKTSKAAARLSNAFKNDEVEKSYLAICHNNFKDKKGVLVNNILKVDKMATESKKGKKAELSYEIIQEDKDLALVKINLKTGRYNQIRFQMSKNATPVYADHKYGKAESGDLALASYSISFIHPVKKEKMYFKELPKGKIFRAFIKENK